uniref:C-C motif chemokine n=1 Tax=Astyanax mexicanus TaxID=7994 RepID=A0A3B1JGV9_ASTMX
MRSWCGSLLLALLIILYLQSCVEGNNSNVPKKCCFKFYPRRIPAGRIIKYEVTRSDCPKAGVIFTTWKSRKLCAHKNQSWVQRAMNEIDQRPFKGTNIPVLNPQPRGPAHIQIHANMKPKPRRHQKLEFSDPG